MRSFELHLQLQRTVRAKACAAHAKATTGSSSTHAAQHERERTGDRSVTCSEAGHAAIHGGVGNAHLKSSACHADVDVVVAGISMRRDRTWRKPHTVFADVSHAAARLQGSDGDAERRQKDAISNGISRA